MGVLIRVLVISFPIVFVMALFWPTIQGKFLTHLNPSEKNIPSESLIVPLEDKQGALPYFPPAAKQVNKKTEPRTKTAIYRWVDENGHVVFSDKPTDENAVKHTPKDIGHVTALASNYPAKTAPLKTLRYSTTRSVMQAKKKTSNFRFSSMSVDYGLQNLLMRGRVSGGFRCERLKVVATAEDGRGRVIRGYDVISYSGSGSKFYEIKKPKWWSGKGSLSEWETKDVYAECLD